MVKINRIRKADKNGTINRTITNKKILAIILTVVFPILSIRGVITAEQFITVFSMVIAFYFGQSSARQAAKEVKKQPIAPNEIKPTGEVTEIR